LECGSGDAAALPASGAGAAVVPEVVRGVLSRPELRDTYCKVFSRSDRLKENISSQAKRHLASLQLEDDPVCSKLLSAVASRAYPSGFVFETGVSGFVMQAYNALPQLLEGPVVVIMPSWWKADPGKPPIEGSKVLHRRFSLADYGLGANEEKLIFVHPNSTSEETRDGTCVLRSFPEFLDLERGTIAGVVFHDILDQWR